MHWQRFSPALLAVGEAASRLLLPLVPLDERCSDDEPTIAMHQASWNLDRLLEMEPPARGDAKGAAGAGAGVGAADGKGGGDAKDSKDRAPFDLFATCTLYYVPDGPLDAKDQTSPGARRPELRFHAPALATTVRLCQPLDDFARYKREPERWDTGFTILHMLCNQGGLVQQVWMRVRLAACVFVEVSFGLFFPFRALRCLLRSHAHLAACRWLLFCGRMQLLRTVQRFHGDEGLRRLINRASDARGWTALHFACGEPGPRFNR